MKNADLRSDGLVQTPDFAAPVANNSVVDAPKASPLTSHLSHPDSIRQTLPEGVNLGKTALKPSTAVRSRLGQRSGRVRQKRLKMPAVTQLSRLEVTNFPPLAQRFAAVLSDVRATLDRQSFDPGDRHQAISEALDKHRDELFTAVRAAIRGSRSSLVKGEIDALVIAGMDAFLFDVLLTGHLTAQAVHSELARVKDGGREGRFTFEQAKKGWVAADGLLQRLALADLPVRYDPTENGPRDLLVTYASALHR